MRISFFILVLALLEPLKVTAETQQIILKDGKFAYDVEQNLYWKRCSFGQSWVEGTCKGEIKKLNLRTASEVASKLSKVDGRKWRLPSRSELAGLLQYKEGYPKIDTEIFPNTYSGPYWTSEENYFDPSRSWTVNFFTGQFFSRFLNVQEQAVRFVTEKE